MTEEVEDIGHEEKVEKAFIESHGHALNGLKFEPYSDARRIAAQSMDLRYGNLTEAQAQRFRETSLYPGAVRDSAIVLWLCTIKDGAEIDRIAANPEHYSDAWRKFAVENGLVDTDQKSFWDGFTVFMTIMNEVDVSRVKAKKKTEAMTSNQKKG
jgi:hypothetical protein